MANPKENNKLNVCHSIGDAAKIISHAQELVENELTETYLGRDMEFIENIAEILNGVKLALLRLEYETKMDVAQQRLEKLKIQEEMLLMKFKYHNALYLNRNYSHGI